MGHITDQYGPYYRPIWAILLTHPLPLPKGGGPKGISRKAYKVYKSYKTYKPYKPILPPIGGIEGG